MAYIGKTRYLELNQVGNTQSISANTVTAVQFQTSVTNTFASNLTLSNTNSRFTNASGANMYLLIAASLTEDSASANQGHAGWIWVGKNAGGAAQTNVTTIGSSVIDGVFADNFPFSVSQPLFLANNDYFEILCASNVAITLGNGAALYSQKWVTSLVVLQLPGI